MRRFLIFLCFGCSVFFSDLGNAAPSDIFLLFDGNGDFAVDASGNGMDIQMRQESQIASEYARFGTGGVKLVGGNSGWSIPLITSPWDVMNEGVERFTIAVWVKPVNDMGTIWLFRRLSQSPEKTGSIGIMYTAKGLHVSLVGISPDSQAASSPKIEFVEPGKWIHFAVTYDKGELNFYVNGEKSGNSNTSSMDHIPPTEPSTTNLSALFASPVGTEFDDYAFFGDRALNSVEIDKLYQIGLEKFLQENTKK